MGVNRLSKILQAKSGSFETSVELQGACSRSLIKSLLLKLVKL